MRPSSRTPEGQPNRCPVCKHEVCIEPSNPPGDATCPCCGQLLWFPSVAGDEHSDLFAGDGVIYELDVATKSEAVEALVRKLSDSGHVRMQDVESIVKAVMRREELGSTAIGSGVAVPHATHEVVQRFVGIIGHVPGGIEFDSLDGEPVSRVFLLLSPPNERAVHLRALEQISQIIRTAA